MELANGEARRQTEQRSGRHQGEGFFDDHLRKYETGLRGRDRRREDDAGLQEKTLLSAVGR